MTETICTKDFNALITFFLQHHDNNSAIMAVGVVGTSPEAIFHEVISLGPSRSE